MKRLWIITTTLLFLQACAPPQDPPVERGDDEVEARQIVWREHFKEGSTPPPVHWWYGRCPSKPDDLRTAVVTLSGICYSGLFYPYQCDVAWRGSFSKSAYSHELMHAWQHTRGIFDPGHSLDEWSQIPIIDVDLASRGL